MSFVPSRDLPALTDRSKSRERKCEEIGAGLYQIERALGAVEGDEEHYYLGGEASMSTSIDRSSQDDDENEEENTFELRHTKDWLTSVSCLRWLPVNVTEDVIEESENLILEDDQAVDEILRRAARLLAICAGKSASGKTRKVYHFTGLPQGQEDVNVRLQEQVLVDDSLGTRTWGAAPLLAKRLLQTHLQTGWKRFDDCEEEENETIRVMELGAGTGLVGLAVAQFIRNQQGRAHVYLTDYHADVLRNLQGNLEMNSWNQNADTKGLVEVEVLRLDWNDASVTNGPTEPFDMLIAADCIYEAEHAKLVKRMAERYLSQECQGRHSASNLHHDSVLSSKMFLLSPLRPTHQFELDSISSTFPVYTSSSSSSPRSKTDSLQLCITHQLEIIGHDDFGPPRLQNLASQDRKEGEKTTFHEYIIQWCRHG
ncbi:hypothetical protein CBS101457_000977 [Exobasidium rhododendri]|nr:hypothetical protein CBS101457_000977 [Exobasidium rhododendri]